MRLSWFHRGMPLDQALFRPPEEVVTRTDTIDELMEKDELRTSRAKRVLLGLSTACYAASPTLSPQSIEIVQVFGGLDAYHRSSTNAHSSASDSALEPVDSP